MGISISSDYAVLDIGPNSFYYGYEMSICCECGSENKGEFCDDHEDADREWCFVASIDSKRTVYKFSELGHKDMFDVEGCLFAGIEKILLSDYQLSERVQGVMYEQ